MSSGRGPTRHRRCARSAGQERRHAGHAPARGDGCVPVPRNPGPARSLARSDACCPAAGRRNGRRSSFSRAISATMRASGRQRALRRSAGIAPPDRGHRLGRGSATPVRRQRHRPRAAGPGGRSLAHRPTAGPVGGVFGMAVDAPRRLLWLASAGVEPMVEPETAFSGIVAIDLDRLQEARRIAGSRRASSATWRSPKTAPSMRATASRGRSIAACPAASPPRCWSRQAPCASPQGMVVARGGRRLYVADYSLGLFRVEIERRQVVPMVVRRPRDARRHRRIALLRARGRADRHPERHAAATDRQDRARSSGGTTIDRVQVLEQNNPASGEPTLGDDRRRFGLVYRRRRAMGTLGRGRRAGRGAPPGPTPIRRIAGTGRHRRDSGRSDPAEPSLASPRPRS